MTELKAAIAELQEGPLAREGWRVRQAYDESIYIEDSIAMLRTNLLLGIVLAVSNSLVVHAALSRHLYRRASPFRCPCSPRFVVMQITGRTLNMISLAGLAFATGMVLDAAIVVLENIVRLREEGVATQRKPPTEGSTQVWGALTASTATTVVIFLPIMFLKDVSGQLFADLALVISVAVTASLIIAVTIIPTAAAKWLHGVTARAIRTPTGGESITDRIMRITDHKSRQALLIGSMFTAATVLTWLLLPPANYLPEGKQGWIFAFIMQPPGQSVTTARSEFARSGHRTNRTVSGGRRRPASRQFLHGHVWIVCVCRCSAWSTPKMPTK